MSHPLISSDISLITKLLEHALDQKILAATGVVNLSRAKELYFFLAKAEAWYMADATAPQGRVYLTVKLGRLLFCDSYTNRTYSSIEAWYEDRGRELLCLTADEALPPLASELRYGYISPTHVSLNYEEIVKALFGPHPEGCGCNRCLREEADAKVAGAGAGAGAASAAPSAERIRQTSKSIALVDQEIKGLREWMKNMVPQIATVEVASIFVSRATALKEALAEKKRLSAQMVELCAAEGDLRSLSYVHFLEQLAAQLMDVRGTSCSA